MMKGKDMDQKKIARPDKDIHIAHHQGLLVQLGEDVRALGYSSTESQQARYSAVSGIGSFDGKSVLDVGCGFGDFYGFLTQKGAQLKNYLGVDINPDMVAIANRRFPNASFEVKDILEDPIEARFDFVVAPGTFGLEIPDWENTVRKMITRMYELSQIGTAVTFLTMFTPGEKYADSHYADPVSMLDFVLRSLSARVILRHDYRPNDFAVYIYRPVA
jgi:SAM-dependent methyltransferase